MKKRDITIHAEVGGYKVKNVRNKAKYMAQLSSKSVKI